MRGLPGIDTDLALRTYVRHCSVYMNMFTITQTAYFNLSNNVE